jgi:DNA gyrase subunit B
MPELVKRGYVHVAQPPLYRLAKGKTERYAVTEDEKFEIMAELGLDKVVLQQPGGRRFAGAELKRLVEVVGKVILAERRMPAGGVVPFADFLAQARLPDCELPAYYVVHGGVGVFVADEARLDAELDRLKEGKGSDLLVYEGPESPGRREDADVEVHALHAGRELQPRLRQLVEFGIALDALRTATKPGWEVQTGDSKQEKPVQPSHSLIEAMTLIQKACEGAVDIQRYKGLGEMNPSQLYESTMDPARRSLKRVSVSDMVEADSMFTVLMGPEVEPRREFIEKHALEATNLDF